MSFEIPNLRKDTKDTFRTVQDKAVSQYNHQVLPRFKMHMDVLKQAEAITPKDSKDYSTLRSIEAQSELTGSFSDAQITLVTTIYMRNAK